MKMADILRNLADKLDGIEKGGNETDRPTNTEKSADDFQHDVTDGAASGNGDAELDQDPTFIPPLQAKLELLKKATGVDNVYNDEETDELGDIKKLTGIKAVIQHEAGEDEPLDA